jgi:hypothetical protein
MRSPFLLAFGLGSVIVAASLTATVSPTHAQTTQFVPCSGNNGGAAGLAAAVNTAQGGVGGTGSGIIQLAPRCTYLFSAPNQGANALPIITGKISIMGQNSVIARAANAPVNFRIARVAPGGYLSTYGITIRGGSVGNGAGILVQGTLSLTSSRITGNSASNNGGGFAGAVGSLTLLTNSVVTGNTALQGGGGATGGTIRSVGSTISDNTALTNGGGLIISGAGRLVDTVVTRNRAQNGAGVYLVNGTLNIGDKSKITRNNALRNGGGLFISANSEATVSNSSITENTAGEAGGGIFNDGTVNLRRAQIAGNTPQNCAGGSPIPQCAQNVTILVKPGERRGSLHAKHRGRK